MDQTDEDKPLTLGQIRKAVNDELGFMPDEAEVFVTSANLKGDLPILRIDYCDKMIIWDPENWARLNDDPEDKWITKPGVEIGLGDREER